MAGAGEPHAYELEEDGLDDHERVGEEPHAARGTTGSYLGFFRFEEGLRCVL